MSFTGLVTPAMRHLDLRLAGITPVERVLDAALGCGSMAAVTLARRVTPPADRELIDLLADLVCRILSRDLAGRPEQAFAHIDQFNGEVKKAGLLLKKSLGFEYC
jgi:hypothetical protein